MKTIAYLTLAGVLAGMVWAQHGSSYKMPGGTTHYTGPNGYHESSYTTLRGTAHYQDNYSTPVCAAALGIPHMGSVDMAEEALSSSCAWSSEIP